MLMVFLLKVSVIIIIIIVLMLALQQANWANIKSNASALFCNFSHAQSKYSLINLIYTKQNRFLLYL